MLDPVVLTLQRKRGENFRVSGQHGKKIPIYNLPLWWLFLESPSNLCCFKAGIGYLLSLHHTIKSFVAKAGDPQNLSWNWHG